MNCFFSLSLVSKQFSIAIFIALALSCVSPEAQRSSDMHRRLCVGSRKNYTMAYKNLSPCEVWSPQGSWTIPLQIRRDDSSCLLLTQRLHLCNALQVLNMSTSQPHPSLDISTFPLFHFSQALFINIWRKNKLLKNKGLVAGLGCTCL